MFMQFLSVKTHFKVSNLYLELEYLLDCYIVDFKFSIIPKNTVLYEYDKLYLPEREFVCSEPAGERCSPQKQVNGHHDWMTVFVRHFLHPEVI